MADWKEQLLKQKADKAAAAKAAPKSVGRPLSLREKLDAAKAERKSQQPPGMVDTIQDAYSADSQRIAAGAKPDDLGGFDMQEVAAANAVIVAKPISAEEYTHSSQPDSISETASTQYNEAMRTLIATMDNKELVAQSLVHIMRILQQETHLANNLAPGDLGAMVRGLRNAYDVAIVKKQVKVEKKKKVDAQQDEIEALIGGDFGNFTLNA